MIRSASDDALTAALARVGLDSVDDLPLIAAIDESVPAVSDLEFTAPTPEIVAKTVSDFRLYLDEKGLDMDLSTRLDLVASYLSSQFVLLAGPSGTGKSTAALALQEFFGAPRTYVTVDARRQLVGPEDLVGYYSTLTGQYVRTRELDTLRSITGTSIALPPSLLVEEINLSPIEGFLSHFMHGLSRPSVESVEWPLHADNKYAEVPMSLSFRPYPRLLGTINVDPTAPAPSPKVTARGCIVLLEPVEELDVAGTVKRILDPARESTMLGAGQAVLQDPRAGCETPFVKSRESEIVAALERTVDAIRPSIESGTRAPNLVTRRQLAQMFQYVSWFILAVEGLGITEARLAAKAEILAAENALLHFVLPSLAATDFGPALSALNSDESPISQPGKHEVESVLASRVKRLTTANEDHYSHGRMLDFWERLS